MSRTGDERRREIDERSANALRLFDEAKRIQRQISALPFFQRRDAMDQVNALEREAVEEAQKSLALEKQLSQSDAN